MGYLCLFEDKDKLHDNDIKEILNLLTVSELHDILCKLKKVYIYWHFYKNLYSHFDSINVASIILVHLMVERLLCY